MRHNICKYTPRLWDAIVWCRIIDYFDFALSASWLSWSSDCCQVVLPHWGCVLKKARIVLLMPRCDTSWVLSSAPPFCSNQIAASQTSSASFAKFRLAPLEAYCGCVEYETDFACCLWSRGTGTLIVSATSWKFQFVGPAISSEAFVSNRILFPPADIANDVQHFRK